MGWLLAGEWEEPPPNLLPYFVEPLQRDNKLFRITTYPTKSIRLSLVQGDAWSLTSRDHRRPVKIPQRAFPRRENMDNNASQSPEADASRRRSGRVTRAPRKFSPESQLEQNAAPKRKRGEAGDEEDIDQDALLESDEDMSEDAPEDDDDEHLPSRKKKSAKSSRSRKPANKRVKTNGASVSGHAASLPSRPKKSVRIERLPHDGSGLYGMLTLKRRPCVRLAFATT